MALEIKTVPREFKFESGGKKVKVADPNPNMSPSEIMELLMSQYPELTTATVGEIKEKDGKMVVEFVTSLGNKG